MKGGEFLGKIDIKSMTEEEIKAGHGGMDWFAYKAFTDALKTGAEMPIDVYDAATWQAVSVLSEISIFSLIYGTASSITA